jgi:hypothetical protein
MKLQPLVTMCAALGVTVVCGCAGRHGHQQHDQAPTLEVPQVTPSLRVPKDQTLMLEANARGVQIYECGVDKGDDTKLAWNFKAPEAELFETHGKLTGQKIGKHYGGPTWEGNDGSKVVGHVRSSENSPDPTAVPWLLLSAESNSGTGIFAKTVSIQRLSTQGGKPPTDGCDGAHKGQQARIPYTAEYYFYN